MPTPLYLDHNATTPIDDRVVDVMLPFLSLDFGNASSSHWHGRRARDAVVRARHDVARLIGAEDDEIIFTSGATESNNLVLKGVRSEDPGRRHIVTSAIEHKAVLDPLVYRERRGLEVTRLRPPASGVIEAEQLQRVADQRLLLSSFMLANNEIGTVNPVGSLARCARQHGALTHVDATQGLGYIPFSVSALEVDFVSFSAHKLYGPKGVGALYVRRAQRSALAPQMLGGAHEHGLRAGTVNVPAIVGFGEACRLMAAEGLAEAERILALRTHLLHQLSARLTGLTVNGSIDERLPGNLSIACEYAESRQVLQAVDAELSISAGSACSATSVEPSHVLRGIGAGHDRASTSLRIGIGRQTTKADIDHAVDVLATAVVDVRNRALATREL